MTKIAWLMKSVLGEGPYGKVYTGSYKDMPGAIKCFYSPSRNKDILLEVDMLLKVQSSLHVPHTCHRAGYSSMFRRSYVQKVLCSEGPLFRRSYVQKVLCSEVLCSEGPMFRNICSEGPMFRKYW